MEWRKMLQKKVMRSQETRSSSSCAACKFLKRRCTPNCLFAPYFQSDEPKKFAKVHKVFGASNVTKILNEVPEEQREDTVNSLVFEAEARLRDPVYGCIGAIASLQGKMFQLQHDLAVARAKLAGCAAKASASSSSSSSFMSPLLVLDHGEFSMDSFGEFAGVCDVSVGSFEQNSLELEQVGSRNEFSGQLQFP